MPMDYSEMTLEEVLRTYSSVKGHRTRYEREINSLIDLLKVQYSAPSEVRINDRLERLEKHTHKLSDITDYQMTAKYTKAKDHVNECATAIFRVIHEKHVAAPQASLAALPVPAPARSPAKPSTELKPEKLSHGATMASFRTWKKQFRAYYDAGHIGSLPCTQKPTSMLCSA